MNPLETYLKERAEIHAAGAGVKETSYYGPLANLLNEIGKTLKPKGKCIINLQNVGVGLPDGRFFTQEQFQKFADASLLPGQIPARGAMEVKPTQDEAWEVTNIARRLAAIVLMEPPLSANYLAVKNSCYTWQTTM